MRTPLVALLVLLLVGCGRVDGQPSVHAHNGALPLGPGVRVGQTFVPAGGEVAAVAVLVSTAGEPVAGTLTVRLRDAPGAPVRARARLDGGALRDNRWAIARFPRPVAVTGGAAFDVAWAGGGTVGVYANVPQDDSPLVNDPYPGGRILRDGAPGEGDLVFDVLGPDRSTVVPTLATAARRAAGLLLAAPGFTTAWLCLLAGAGALALAGGRPARSARRFRVGAADGPDLDLQADVAGDQEPARLQDHVPGQAPVLPIDLRGGREHRAALPGAGGGQRDPLDGADGGRGGGRRISS